MAEMGIAVPKRDATTATPFSWSRPGGMGSAPAPGDMHILIGAIVGGAIAAVTIVVAAAVLRRKLTAKNVLLGVLGGVVAGAVTSATLGASSLVGVAAGRQVAAFTLGGAVGGAAERAADNAVEGRDLDDGVAKATAIGAGVGFASLGVLKTSSAAMTRIAPSMVRSGGSFTSRLLTAPAPGTGGGLVRTWEEDSASDPEDTAVASDAPPTWNPAPAPVATLPPPAQRQGLSDRLGF